MYSLTLTVSVTDSLNETKAKPAGFCTVTSVSHWGRVTHICIGKLTIIGSDNSLSPERRQAIIWINAGILLIGPLGTNFSEILIEIQAFSFKKMRLKMSSAKWWPFCLGLNVVFYVQSSHLIAVVMLCCAGCVWYDLYCLWQHTLRPVAGIHMYHIVVYVYITFMIWKL